MLARARPHIAAVALATAALIVLTCAYSWPLVLHPGSGVPHDRGDPLLVSWILWWSTKTVPLTAAWWNAPAFYPASGVLAFSETLLGLAPLTAPIIWLSSSPLLAYNAAFLASFVLSGLGAYALGFVLTRQHGASFVAALAFAFAPYRLSHLQHVQLLSSYWMPVSLAALHLFSRRPRTWWAVVFAACWMLQALACGYYFFFLSLLVLLWLAWFAARAWSARATLRLAACWIAAGLLLVPLFAGYKRIQDGYGYKRVPSEIAYYSADGAGIFSASPDSWLWHGVHAVEGRPESEIFPGLTIVLLAAAGAAFAMNRRSDPDRAALRFYLGAALFMWLLALGPWPAWRGEPTGVPGPYAALMALPGFNGMRVPARLWMLAVLCLAATAALVVSRIRHVPARRAITACAALGLLLDGWPGSFAVLAAPEMRVTTTRATARLGLPLRGNETETMYGAMAQSRPVFNGYSGYEAPQHPALRDLLDTHDQRILARLSAHETIEAVIERELDPDGAWRAFVAAHPGARLVDETPAWSSYEIPPSGDAAPAPPRGFPLRIARLDASTNAKDVNAILDGDLDTRWHSLHQDGGETIVADLGDVRDITWVVMSLGTYASQYPRALEVSTSLDGIAWTSRWTGRPALETYDAAVRAPREVPVAIPVGGRGRFVRLRQTSATPRADWTIVELKVLE